MKKLVLASVMALASIVLVPAPTLLAQDTGGSISIKDPTEFAAYSQATGQSDPKLMAAALESFLTDLSPEPGQAGCSDQARGRLPAIG